MTVTEFLEARIAEDEAGARGFPGRVWSNSFGTIEDDQTSEYGTRGTVLEIGYDGGYQDGVLQHVARWDPARVLAECAAKRKVIAAALDDTEAIDLELACCHSVAQIRDNLCPVNEPGPVAIRALAAVYSDHPDYDKEWAL